MFSSQTCEALRLERRKLIDQVEAIDALLSDAVVPGARRHYAPRGRDNERPGRIIAALRASAAPLNLDALVLAVGGSRQVVNGAACRLAMRPGSGVKRVGYGMYAYEADGADTTVTAHV